VTEGEAIHPDRVVEVSRGQSRSCSRQGYGDGSDTSPSGQTPSVLQTLESWLHRRLRSVVWQQRKRGWTRFRELRKRNVSKDLAAQTVGSPHGPWRLANSPALAIALPNAYFAKLGLPPMVVRS
jgi:hypothetical protein